ncbi:CotY/CotZ family spore coat protein [Rummeliibacillus sp. G93]|uniref:CotY/CotZ family spore coat protein n=1 Tax=Rummeliibacillus TaxID=648802 RepID=UPI00116FAADF|nr:MULTISPECIES: CotY/CotZ family spore coat protein [Rummeliibacillus]MBB5170099.1 spore coat protein Z [Rummeliibacillus stabekisii]UQW98105.1 CotY/CotZ family spore coat protein [Rummeliibacillus sp. G93]GEL04358.1 spore coat protein Y [Rummeliibacillus stabekisii]
MGCGRESTSVSPIMGGNCVCDVLQTILDLQVQRENNECGTCPTSCFLEPLGGLVSPSRSNADTRVFMLVTKDGTPFKAFFKNSRHHHRNSLESTSLGGMNMNNHHNQQHHNQQHHNHNQSCFSVFFRVEDIFDDCCATLRVLKPNRNILKECGSIDFNKICEVTDFELTDSCITVDLNCFCGVQCVQDVFLDVCR